MGEHGRRTLVERPRTARLNQKQILPPPSQILWSLDSAFRSLCRQRITGSALKRARAVASHWSLKLRSRRSSLAIAAIPKWVDEGSSLRAIGLARLRTMVRDQAERLLPCGMVIEDALRNRQDVILDGR